MKGSIQVFANEKKDQTPSGYFSLFTPQAVAPVLRFHQSFPDYAPTPLVPLDELAKTFGVASIHVKDESYRFGLNAFKSLGGSFCIGRYLAEQLGISPDEMTYDFLTAEETRKKLGVLTFATTTDGNHGRGIAWTAQRLGHKSVVTMPKGSALERLENIRALGADAEITQLNYDDAVRDTYAKAQKNGWIFVQDTAWEGYEKIPAWIMQGYTTMLQEAVAQYDTVNPVGHVKPTHVFLQAGVGAYAGAAAGFLHAYYGKDCPKIIVVEPDEADCLYRTAKAQDGTLHTVSGDMPTMMAGLACGEPCSIGWEILKRTADFFVSIPDAIAARGMRVLGNPLGTDRRIISGESGAATMGFVSEVLAKKDYAPLRQMLGLDAHAHILCISTEGDTDRENYRAVVWDGKENSEG